MRDLLIPSFLVCDVSESLRSLTKNERCEQIAQFAQQKLATMSGSLRSLTKNELMSKLLVFLANRSFVHFLQKTSDSLRKPMSEFPALIFHRKFAWWIFTIKRLEDFLPDIEPVYMSEKN